jgi:hypothetical protein
METLMNPDQAMKLQRYLRNAEKFLWGVIPGNKLIVFTELRALLKELGHEAILPQDKQQPPYAIITEKLIVDLGIELVVRDLVAAEVRRQFNDRPGALDLLRAHWISGTLPRWPILQSLRKPKTVGQKVSDVLSPRDSRPTRQTVDILDAFVEINAQYQYVHGWTVFTGLWFEEIEPLLGEKSNAEK